MPNEKDFTFAIITDTHIRAPEGDLSSPFPVNGKANGRARHAVRLIKANQPELTVHLGDMVHPLPHLPAYESACREARSIFAGLEPNLHFVPGNHDIGDKPAKALPAGPVTQESRQAFEAAFGVSRWAFMHRDAWFISVNSSLVNSDLPEEAEQKNWFEAVLGDANGSRIFVFSHYPPFIDTPAETEHYDNYAEPGRSWFLDCAADHRVEAIFSGHVHQFFFNTYRGVKLYCLPPTSFTRQDYSELYRSGPAPEFGRDDAGKFGITLIDFEENGHRLRFAPSGGMEAGADEEPGIAPLHQPVLPIVPHLRHGWSEATLLPYNGPMEEFSRKRARNDYPLLRLWQLGIGVIRTPLADLVNPSSRRRVLDFAAAGLKFCFFHLGIPDDETLQIVNDHEDLVAGLEIVTTDIALLDIGPDLDGLLNGFNGRVTVGKATTSADEHRAGGAFSHMVSYGFLWADHSRVLDSVKSFAKKTDRFSVCFQVNLEDDLNERIEDMASVLEQAGLGLTVVLRLADRNPAKANFDDALIARRLISALETVETLPGVQLQCDTFEDIDRGYAPRNGIVDRLSNMRAVGRQLLDWRGS